MAGNPSSSISSPTSSIEDPLSEANLIMELNKVKNYMYMYMYLYNPINGKLHVQAHVHAKVYRNNRISVSNTIIMKPLLLIHTSIRFYYILYVHFDISLFTAFKGHGTCTYKKQYVA